MLAIGTKVKISPNSQHYTHYASNPRDTIGTVIRNNEPSDYEYNYKVVWSNGYENSYRQYDLIPCEFKHYVECLQ